MKHSDQCYTAAFQPDGYVDFKTSSIRPIMGNWETPDYHQEASFPATVEVPVNAGCTGFDG